MNRVRASTWRDIGLIFPRDIFQFFDMAHEHPKGKERWARYSEQAGNDHLFHFSVPRGDGMSFVLPTEGFISVPYKSTCGDWLNQLK